MEMWNGKLLASLLQALQLMYGLGSIVGPLIAKPYLKGYIQSMELITDEVIQERRYSLSIPHFICGAIECSGT